MGHHGARLLLVLAAGACACAAPGGRRAAPGVASAALAERGREGERARGEAALRENRFEDAERSFRAAVEVAPADPRAWADLAEARYGQRRVEEAIDDLGRSLAAGETARALILRGRYLCATRRFDESARDLERAVVLEPGDGLAWVQLVVAHLNRGDEIGVGRAWAGAVRAVGRERALDRLWIMLLATPPDPVQPQEALERCSRGHAHLVEGRFAEARHELFNGLRYARDFGWCIAGIAEASWKLGQGDEAEEVFRRVIASYPPSLEALRADGKGKLAALLLSEGRGGAEAADLARAALAVRGDRAALLDVLGRACQEIGDAPCERDAWERLLRLGHVPDEMRVRAEDRLRSLPSPAPAGERRSEAGPLFRVLQGGKWGFIDRRGRIAIPPRFDRAEGFSEGLASVQEGGTLGYVDAAGRMVLVPSYEPAATIHRSFASGRAAVRQGARHGYIDREGRLAIPLRFVRADDFSEGFALVCDARGCGYVDRSGVAVVQPVFMGGKPVREGLGGAYVAMAMGRERVSLYDFVGLRQIGEFEGTGTPSGGLVAVAYNEQWGYLDLEGKGVIPPAWAWAGRFSEGLAPVKDESDLCGYIDRSGAVVISPRFRSCEPFADGLARVDLAQGRTGEQRVAFVDRTGRPVIVGAEAAPPFDGAEDFSDGLAAVARGGEPALAGSGPRLGYIDTSGRYVWPPSE